MPAYVIFIRDGAVRDPAEMEIYQTKGMAASAGFTMKGLSIYGEMEVVEGRPAEGIVIVEFPSLEEAKAWYHSPAYQAAVAHRKKAADFQVLIVQGM